MNENRIESLQRFRDYARAADLDHDFQQLLNTAQELLEMSDQEIGDSLRVSRPTVNRWMRGKSLPHRALRKPIAEWIVNQLTARIRRIETAARYSLVS